MSMERKAGHLIKSVQEIAGSLFWIKVVGIGNDGVGKTCLVKNFCEKKFSKSYHPTVGVDYGFKLHKVNNIDYRINFWDFGGHTDYDEIRVELYGQTQACILVFDVTNKLSFDSLDYWMQEFISNGGKQAIVAVVANKIDLSSKRVISSKDGQRWAKSRDLRYYETSAATGQGVQDMFSGVLAAVAEGKLVKAKPVVSAEQSSSKHK